MSAEITSVTVRRMQVELDQLEAQANRELQNRKTRGLGMLRMALVEECRRKLLFVSIALKRSTHT
jgi:hypothetical protein